MRTTDNIFTAAIHVRLLQQTTLNTERIVHSPKSPPSTSPPAPTFYRDDRGARSPRTADSTPLSAGESTSLPSTFQLVALSTMSRCPRHVRAYHAAVSSLPTESVIFSLELDQRFFPLCSFEAEGSLFQTCISDPFWRNANRPKVSLFYSFGLGYTSHISLFQEEIVPFFCVRSTCHRRCRRMVPVSRILVVRKTYFQ
jgi:hypothetical protein